jgi:hypothetical protein
MLHKLKTNLNKKDPDYIIRTRLKELFKFYGVDKVNSQVKALYEKPTPKHLMEIQVHIYNLFYSYRTNVNNALYKYYLSIKNNNPKKAA